MSEMDDFVEYLSGQAQSDAASFHQFMILYDDDDDALHLFFEGDEDPAFYLPHVRPRLDSRPVRVYICGGKRPVMSVRSDIEEGGYDVSNCLFFLDRDYDCYLGTQDGLHQQTYLTEFYSIENHIATDEAVEVILVDIMGMSHADPDFVRIWTALTDARVAFAKAMLPWMAWCLASKERGEKPNFNNAKLQKSIRFLGDGTMCVSQRAFRSFRKDVKVDTTVSRAEMLRWRSAIKGDNVKMWLRGKFDLWMFESFLLACLCDLAARRKAEKSRVPRIPSALRERRLFDLLGGRVRAPATLAAFLDERLVA